MLNSSKDGNIFKTESVRIKDLKSEYFAASPASDDLGGFSSESDTHIESNAETHEVNDARHKQCQCVDQHTDQQQGSTLAIARLPGASNSWCRASKTKN